MTRTIKGLFLVRDLAMKGAATQRRFTMWSQGERGLQSDVTVCKVISYRTVTQQRVRLLNLGPDEEDAPSTMVSRRNGQTALVLHGSVSCSTCGRARRDGWGARGEENMPQQDLRLVVLSALLERGLSRMTATSGG